MASKQSQQVAVVQADPGPSGVAKMWSKIWPWGAALVALYVVLQVGLPTTVDWLDPGGSGGVIDRIPHVVRNLGIIGSGAGLVLSLLKPWKGLGHHMLGYGVLAIVSGIFGPTLISWLIAHGPDGLQRFLDSLGGLHGLQLK